MAEKKNRKAQRYPLIEWVSAAIGFAITAGIFGFLGYEAVLQRESATPVMEVVPVSLVSEPDRFIVEFKVSNLSRSTAGAVHVEGTLGQGNRTLETSNATIDYVPGLSFRHGGLVFTRDPRQFEVELRVTGYERP